MKSLLLSLMLAATVAQGSEPIHSELGRGVLLNVKEAGLKDTCIHFDPSKVFTEDSRLTSYQLQLVKTRNELSDKISTSGSTSGSYGMYSAASKASFVKEVEWNQYSNYILVRAMRVSQKQNLSMERITLTDESLNVLRNSRFNFAQSCGSSFATSIELGGEIYGLIEIKGSSRLEKQKIEASLSGSGAYNGVKMSGSADYQRTIRKLATLYRVKVDFQHIGGKHINAPNDVDGLLSLSNQIEEISDNFPVPLALLTRDYTTVSNFDLGLSRSELEIRQLRINEAAQSLETAENLFAKILYILEYPNDFVWVKTRELKAKKTYLQEKIIELKSFIFRSASFMNDIQKEIVSVDLDIQLPPLSRETRVNGLNVSCAVKPSPICGVETYKEDKTVACGVLKPLEGTGPVCGTLYKEAVAEACGVKTYNEGKGAVCGVALYRKCYNGRPRRPGGPRPHNRDKSCGVESYKTCRAPAFGVQEFNSCRNEVNGIERYKTCADKEFGYEYASCRHFSHGADTFKSCEMTVIGDRDTTCPKF